MPAVDRCLVRSVEQSGEVVVRGGMRLVDDYLELLSGRCRPNTVLASAYDLKVFFSVVDKEPAQIVAEDVLAFITAQRTGRVGGVLQPVDLQGEPAAVSTRTVRACRACRVLRVLAGPG